MPGGAKQGGPKQGGTVPRAKRADAALNSQRLVQAAREVFAEQGLSATLHDIAEHAGVGIGTIYRNFASKQQIVETLYDAAVESALSDVEAALRLDDPWTALVTFFEVTAESQARDRGLTETLLRTESIGPHESTAHKILDAVSPLFDRASAAGVLRPGVSVTDILPIFAMLGAVYRVSDGRPELWRRYLAMLLDGLRGDGRPALSPAALDAAAFTAALGRSR